MTPSPLIIATRNRHKLEEIRAMLGSRFTIWSLEQVQGALEVEEDGATFEANARKKARALAQWLKQAPPGATPMDRGFENVRVLADDSGLEVDALDGAPGVHSARFAALEDPGQSGNAPDVDNNAKLIRLLENVPEDQRTGRFRCVMALVEVESGKCRVYAGDCPGRLRSRPSGGGGFGYDPLFVPDGYDRTFAELGDAIKNRISHRARALQALQADLLG
jgi:XTP/dITP diphosphohydrolase